MTDYLKKTSVLVLSTLFVLAPTAQVAQADEVKEGGYRRLAANTRGFNAVVTDEITVTAQALAPSPGTPFANGGVVIYDKTVLVPEDINVLFISISATGDVHGGARMLLACLVDDTSCVQSQIPHGAPAGWVDLQRHKDYNLNYVSSGAPFIGDGFGGGGDLQDNSVHYTWCRKIKNAGDHGAIHNVKIKMASLHVEPLMSDLEGLVAIQAVHFYIDGARLPKKDACTTDTTPIPLTK
jgi:hypothetical protein